MCVSAWPAQFSKTITGTWEVLVDNTVNHVLWYQNRVGIGNQYRSDIFEVIVRQCVEGRPSLLQVYAREMQSARISKRDLIQEVNNRLQERGKPLWDLPPLEPSNANALIIPLLGEWHSIKHLDTSQNESILEDIKYALGPAISVNFTNAAMAGVGFAGAHGEVIFQQFAIYDIVLAESALDLSEALKQIRPERRPAINAEVFEAVAAWYDCPVALCCFNNEETGESRPLAFAFKPLYPDKLVLYTLDGHDGKAPDLQGGAVVDHCLFVGSYLATPGAGAQVRYKEPIPEHLQPYVLNKVQGLTVSKFMTNGDFICDAKAVRAGRFEAIRSVPPKAPNFAATAPEVLTRTASYFER